jgi:hypothetical protein
MATVLDGPGLTQLGTWEGSTQSHTERDYGRGLGILNTSTGTQLAFLSIFGVWVVDGDAPSGAPAEVGAVQLSDNPVSLWSGLRLDAVDAVGTPDEDVVLECYDGLPGGVVCVVEGPVLADRSLSDSDLIVTGGTGLDGADLDADGRNDLILGASNAQDDHGEISVLFSHSRGSPRDSAPFSDLMGGWRREDRGVECEEAENLQGRWG